MKKTQIGYLKADKAPIKVPRKYADFADVFLSKLAIELPKYTEINNHAIELVDDQQLFYSLIYSLSPVKLRTLKTYIENNLTNSFIRFSKFTTRKPIFFDKKSDKSLRLYINYQDLNNLIIQNWYPLLFVRESLNLLNQA